jgi:B12 binding domain
MMTEGQGADSIRALFSDRTLCLVFGKSRITIPKERCRSPAVYLFWEMHREGKMPDIQANKPGASRLSALNKRKVLCVFPAYASSFGTFEHAYPLRENTRAFMPPQGLLVITSVLPANWDVRFIDENIAPAGDADFEWADAVFVSGMHIQRDAIEDIGARAHAHDKATVLGGPSVSACPERHPEFDYLHVGELGDATAQIVAALDKTSRQLSHHEKSVPAGGRRIALQAHILESRMAPSARRPHRGSHSRGPRGAPSCRVYPRGALGRAKRVILRVDCPREGAAHRSRMIAPE